ncbi:MAG: DUF4159 domain-containing protein [Acidobacteria bacterium]|nr:DUF4159 domain-containing protein [Acidobacteriota bacterium]MBI3656303.1 DUF4159 domain-containing protein [Acidobacteriota bacterium]
MKDKPNRRLAWIGSSALLLAGSLAWAPAKIDDKGKPTQFKYARIKYEANSPFYDPRYGPPYSHDFPTAERNLMRAVSEFTRTDVYHDGVIVDLDSPDLFKYPFAYLCEVGYFTPSEKEVKNLREYLLRGGFLIVDDFAGGSDWQHFQAQMRRVFPDKKVEPLTLEHPIFHAFFNIETLEFHSYRGWGTFYGLSDDKGRLMMIIDVNNDVSEYWEWANTPYMSVSETNEAFKLGINYVVYALSH